MPLASSSLLEDFGVLLKGRFSCAGDDCFKVVFLCHVIEPGNDDDDDEEVPSEYTAVATEADLKAIEEDWSWGCLVAG